MIPEVKEPEKTDVQNAAEKGAAELKPTEEVKATEKVKIQTVNEYIADAPKEIQEVLNHGMNTYNEKRNSLVELILANENNTFNKDYLVTKDIKELEAIANFCKPAVSESVDNRFDYSGQAPVYNAETTEEPLALPSTL